MALVFPLPEISRFDMPPPFKGVQHHTMGLDPWNPHPSSMQHLAGRVHSPGQLDLQQKSSKSDVPTFGAFYLGREITQTDHFPDCASKELMDNAQKRGKGQKDVLIGALYRGAGVGLKFFALKWQNLQIDDDDDRSSSDDFTYRGINRRT